MKKPTKVSSLLLAALLCIAALFGVANAAPAKARASGASDDLTVGVTLAKAQDKHSANINAALTSVFQGYQFTSTIYDANDDVNVQIEQINMFITQGVDAIVIEPVDETTLYNPIQVANEAGIIIIIIGQSNLHPEAIYIDFDYIGEAENTVDDFLNNHYDPSENNNVLIVAHYSEHGRNYKDTVSAKIKKETVIIPDIIEINDTVSTKEAVMQWIEANNRQLPSAIFCCCDENANAAKEALLELEFTFGSSGMPLYGFFPSDAHHYNELAKTVAELILRVKNEEYTPTGNDLFLIGFCHCEDEYSA